MVPEAETPRDRSHRVAIVQSDKAIATLMDAIIHTDPARGICCDIYSTVSEFRAADLSPVDLVICDQVLKDGTWREVLNHARDVDHSIGVIITGPANQVAVAMEAIRAGAVDVLSTSERDLRTLPFVIEKCVAHQQTRSENARLHNELSESLAEVETKNQQLETVIQQLEMMARTDELTGLANRRWLDLMLAGSWAEATRHDLPLGFLMMDLDGFKPLNDALGHHRGDEILRQVGRVILANCRQVDVCARYGGDEFSVLLPHTGISQTLAVAQRVKREFGIMARGLMEKAEVPQIGISIGISHIDLSRPLNGDILMQHADEALYAAKASGRDRIMVRDRHEVAPDFQSIVTRTMHEAG